MKSLTVDKKFIMTSDFVLPLVQEKNYNLRAHFQEFFLIFVKELIQNEGLVDRIIRRLARLSISDIHIILQSYNAFETYVLETE